MAKMKELHAALEALGACVHVSGGGAAVALCQKAYLVEISAVRAVCSFCVEALTGKPLERSALFLSQGQIRDLRDDAAAEGRLLKAQREEVESALAGAPVCELLGPERALLEELGAAETCFTEAARTREARRVEALASGLADVVGTVTAATTAALAGFTTAPLEELDASVKDVLRRLDRAVEAWLASRADWGAWAEGDEVAVPLRLSVAAARDAALAEHIDAFRSASRLRRLQFSLGGAVRRLDCAVAALDVEAALRRRIRL